jgi:hypothetical protein
MGKGQSGMFTLLFQVAFGSATVHFRSFANALPPVSSAHTLQIADVRQRVVFGLAQKSPGGTAPHRQFTMERLFTAGSVFAPRWQSCPLS